jgi:hypothetical protein
LVEPGFGPIGAEVATTVQAAAEALHGVGVIVEPVRIPALERDNSLDVFNRLHVMEMKPAFKEATAGHENEMFKISKGMLATPDTPMADFIDAEQAAGGSGTASQNISSAMTLYSAPCCPSPHTRMGFRKSLSMASQCPPCRSKALPRRST